VLLCCLDLCCSIEHWARRAARVFAWNDSRVMRCHDFVVTSISHLHPAQGLVAMVPPGWPRAIAGVQHGLLELAGGGGLLSQHSRFGSRRLILLMGAMFPANVSARAVA